MSIPQTADEAAQKHTHTHISTVCIMQIVFPDRAVRAAAV